MSTDIVKVWMVTVGYGLHADVSFYDVSKMTEKNKADLLAMPKEEGDVNKLHDLYQDTNAELFPGDNTEAEIKDLVNTPMLIKKTFFFSG